MPTAYTTMFILHQLIWEVIQQFGENIFNVVPPWRRYGGNPGLVHGWGETIQATGEEGH